MLVDFRLDVTRAGAHFESADGVDAGRPLKVVALSASRHRVVMPRRLPRSGRRLVITARLPDDNSAAWALKFAVRNRG